ncbi:MAG: 4Fe-4S dicluster domain-containing protein [Desulfatitalea sp.]|nr:4Fe-4S dicluster domain-containing protein [Desulfatitalea sp.]
MTTSPNLFAFETLDRSRSKEWPWAQDLCLTCANCSGACPVAGVDDFDPRKVVRMVSLGMTEHVAAERWPWICTMCGKCEQVCPMGIAIPDIMRRIRSLRARDQIPGILQGGLDNALRLHPGRCRRRDRRGRGFRGFHGAHRQRGRQHPHHHPQQAGQHPHRRLEALVEDFSCRR